MRKIRRHWEPETTEINGVLAIPLSRGKKSLIDESDFELIAGFIWWANQLSEKYWRAIGRKRGCKPFVYMHRLIIGAGIKDVVDHINGDALDNRRSNLRFATKSQNGANRQSDGFRGVGWSKAAMKWRSYIKVNYQYEHLGCFDTPEEAALAYDARAKEVWGPFASLNFPD